MKKGQGLPLNTIVIAILVIIVLVLVVTFFLGGFAGLTTKIRGIFFGTTAGTSVTLAVQQCQIYCENAQLLPTDILKKNSPYCKPMEIDEDGDGKTDYKSKCSDLGIPCPKVEDVCE